MNLYIIVEGSQTELQVYPAWMECLAPHMKKIDNAWDVNENTYYLFSAGGIPSIYNHIVHAVEDINSINSKGEPQYNILMVCMDTEEESRQEIEERIKKDLQDNHLQCEGFELVIYEHKVCMETWFLGNRSVFKRTPQDETYREYIQFYNVADDDPELMETIYEDWTKAQFHYQYLKKMFHERHMRYSKSNTKEVQKQTYLNQLIARFNDTGDISSFGRWYNFISSL